MARTPAPPRPKRQLAKAAGPTLSQQAQGELDPVIAAIAGAANTKAAAAEAAIKGYTDSYAHQLAGMDAGAPYAGAETQQAAVDAALRQALAGGGGDLASQLSGRLSALQGSSGAGALAQEGGALASQGQSAGNTRLASGSAALSALLGEHAAASSFSAKLPGLARLSGLQGLRQAEGNAQQDIAQGTTQVESQLPSVIQQIRSSRQAARALQSENAYRGAELQQGQQRIGISAANAATSRFRANVSAQQGQARINIAASRAAQTALNENRNYQLGLARLGVSQKNAQLRWLSTEAKLKGGGFSPTQTRAMQVQANQIASDAAKKNATLQQIMHTMVVNDIPPSVALKAAKIAGYNPGKVGMFSGLGNAFRKGLAAEASSLINPGHGKGGMGVGPSGAQTLYPTAHGHAGGFLPRGASFVLNRKDQGRDIQTRPGMPIIAPGDGYVVRVASDPGGGGAHFGPSYPVVFFTSGPYKGHYVYIGHTVSALRAGQHFRAGAALSHTQRSGPLNGGAPNGWAEIGYAPGGSPGSFGQPAPF